MNTWAVKQRSTGRCTRSQGHVTDAPVTTTEKVVTAVGAGLFVLYMVGMVLLIALAVVSSAQG